MPRRNRRNAVNRSANLTPTSLRRSGPCPFIETPDEGDAAGRVVSMYQAFYGTSGSDLAGVAEQADGFRDTLRGERALDGFVDVRDNGVGIARVMRPDLPVAPADRDDAQDEDRNDIDDAHIAYFTGHGGWGVLKLYDETLGAIDVPSDKLGWGDGLLRWLVVDACQVLHYAPLSSGDPDPGWRQAYAGLRVLLGWDSFSEDEKLRGARLAEYLNAGLSMTTAWRLACEETTSRIPALVQNDLTWNERRWSYLRAVSNADDTFGDRWGKRDRDRPVTATAEDESDLRFVWVTAPA